MEMTFRPLVWTGPRTPADARQSRYVFKATWQSTLDLLDRELWHLDATRVMLEADFREGDLRIDGMPRANARQPEFPGVRLSFNTRRHGRLAYATDGFDFWQHSVRAIALGLEALRKVDRYGIASGGQQYTGWKAIESGSAKTSREAAGWLLVTVSKVPLVDAGVVDVLTDPIVARRVGRIAARKAHPDSPGGSEDEFNRVQEARQVLGVL